MTNISLGPGTPVAITVTVKNRGKEPVSLQFSSGQKYDIEIRRGRDKKNEQVWLWSRGRMFIQALASVPIAAGKSLTFNEVFRPSAAGAPPLSPGYYTLSAYLTTMGRTPRPADSTVFRVK